MLKDILINTINEIVSRENNPDSVFKRCIDVKLERSLHHYEENLMDTCRYVLSRNPITMLKGMSKELVGEDKEE